MTKFTNTIMYNTGCEYFFDLRKARYVSQKKEAIGKKKLLFPILIFSLGLMGIGYSTWQDSLTLNASLATGYIRPVFKEATLFKAEVGRGQAKNEGFAKKGKVGILNNGKDLWVKLNGAHHGDVYYLNYMIANEGSLPFSLTINPIPSDETLEIRNLQAPTEVPVGHSTWGQVEIYVNAPKLNKASQSSFMVVLDCQQTGLL